MWYSIGYLPNLISGPDHGPSGPWGLSDCGPLVQIFAIRDCNPGLEFSIPGFDIVEFPIPGSRRDWRSIVKTTKIVTCVTVFGSLFLNYKCVRSCYGFSADVLHPCGTRQSTMAICCVGVSGLQSSGMRKELSSSSSCCKPYSNILLQLLLS